MCYDDDDEDVFSALAVSLNHKIMRDDDAAKKEKKKKKKKALIDEASIEANRKESSDKRTIELDERTLTKLTVKTLRDLCEEERVSKVGKKKELIERLVNQGGLKRNGDENRGFENAKDRKSVV